MTTNKFHKKELISSIELAQKVSYTNDYISRLCRYGKVEGEKIGNAWYVDEASFRKFAALQESTIEGRNENLAERRRAEYVAAQGGERLEPSRAFSFAASLVRVGVIALMVGVGFSITADGVSEGISLVERSPAYTQSAASLSGVLSYTGDAFSSAAVRVQQAFGSVTRSFSFFSTPTSSNGDDALAIATTTQASRTLAQSLVQFVPVAGLSSPLAAVRGMLLTVNAKLSVLNALDVSGVTTLRDALRVVGASTFTGGLEARGGITTNNTDINAGTGRVFASNLINTITAGTNIAITGTPQNPIISAIVRSSGGGGGATGIRSLSIAVPSFLSVSGSPVTSSGTITIGLGSGALPVTNGGTGSTSPSGILVGSSTALTTLRIGTGLSFDGETLTNTASGGGSGTVTSVQASGGSTGLSFTGGPVTTSGTLTLGGTLDVTNGGTGANSFAYGLVLGNGTNDLTSIATSSLGLLTTDVAEGTNLYYTDTRVNTFVGASTTVAKTYLGQVWSGLQEFFGNASTTALTVSGQSWFNATTTLASNLVLGANPSCGGGYALQTTSTGEVVCGPITAIGSSEAGGWSTDMLGNVTIATSTDRVAIGATTTPYAKLTIESGSTATTTLALLPFVGQTANILDIYDNVTGALSSVFTAAGRLGLGTTSPWRTLSVEGDAAITGHLAVPYATTTALTVTGTSYLETASTTNFSISRISGALLLASSTTGLVEAYGGATTCIDSGLLVQSINADGTVTCATTDAGGIAGIVPVANGGTGWSNIYTGALLYGNGTSALATTTAGTAGNVLALLNGVPTWTATTTFSSGLAYANGNVTNTGVLSLKQQYGNAQTGSITLATSTNAINNDWGITDDGVGTLTFNLPDASGTVRGLLKAADFASFAAKQAALSFEYPLKNIANVISLDFGTSTSNLWGGTQTFTNNPVLGTLTGLVAANNGTLYQAASSTLFGTGTGGQVLTWNDGEPQWVATTTYTGGAGINTSFAGGTLTITNTGVTSLAATYPLITSGATGSVTLSTALATTTLRTQYETAGALGDISFATSSDTNLGLTITRSGGAFTFSPTWSGVLGVLRGGTASTTALGGILVGNGTNPIQSLLIGSGLSFDGTTLTSTGTGGTVTSIDASGGTTGLSFTGGPVTTSGTLTLGGTLGVANGGTGRTTFTSGELLYGNGTNGLTSVGTTTATLGSEFSYSGTLGSLVGGVSGTLSLASNSIGLSKLVQTAANTILGNPTGAPGNVQAFATSTLGIALADTTGTLAIARGGTNATSQVSGGVNYFDGTSITSGAALVFDGTRLGIGTTTPGSLLSLGNTGADTINLSATATSTFGYSLDLRSGCYAVNGVCISAAGLGGLTQVAATYPLTGNGTIGSPLVLAFGTTTANQWSGLQEFNGGASTTALTVTGTGYFNLASSTNTIISSITNALIKTDATGLAAAYTGSDCGTAFVQSISALGVASCATPVGDAGTLVGVVPVPNGGTGWGNIVAGALLYGNGTSALATTTAGTAGNVLALLNGVPTWTATTTFSSGLAYANGNVTNTGVTSLAATYPLITSGATGNITISAPDIATTSVRQVFGTAQTGDISFATSTLGVDDNVGLTITNTGGAFTFSPTWTGSLAVARGGTGSTTLTGILLGDGTNMVKSLTLGTGLTLTGTTLNTPWTISGNDIYSNNSGNVGVGVVSPSSKLDVGGSVNISAGSGYKQAGDTILYALGAVNNSIFGGIGAGTASAGAQNAVFGAQSLSSATVLAVGNTSMGYYSLHENTDGNSNTAVGMSALAENVAGNENTAIGVSALAGYVSGNNNIGIGALAGSLYPASGSNNIIIGNYIDLPAAASSNMLSIGNLIYGTGLSTAAGVGVSTGNIGIATSSPWKKFSVAGDVSVTGAFFDSFATAGGSGSILSSTVTGTKWLATSTLGIALADTTGTLAIARGGTNATSQTTNGVNYYNGTSITSGSALVFDGTRLGIGTTTPGSLLSLGDTGDNTINLAPAGVSTFGNGINIRSGCYAINGTCLSLSSFTGILSPTYGGTGVNNGSFTITLGGNVTTAGSFTTSGANALTLTTTGATNVTLPTTGTLATLAGSEVLTNKTLSGNTATNLISGAGTLTLNTSGTVTLPNTTGTATVGTGGANQIAYWSGTNTLTGVTAGANSFLTTNGSNVPALTAISADTFTQYALLAGRSGGQTITGGTAANNTLTIQGNNATGNTSTSANLTFKVGDSAGTTAMTILNNGNVGIGTASPSAALSVGASSVFQVNSSGAIAAATGITSSGNITFSGLTGLLKGNGASAVSAITDSSTVGNVLRVAAGPTYAWGALDLTAAGTVGTSILGSANGGTGNAFFAVSGPATAVKTFTFPNQSATVLTDAAAVTVAQGGTGAATFIGGLLVGNGTSAFITRTLTGPAEGISISNGTGVAGNPTLALSNDLSAIEGLTSTGFAVRSATDTWVQRVITGTTNRVTVTNGGGVVGNPVIDISSSYVGQNTITTLGTVTTGTWNGTTIAIANGGTNATSQTTNGVNYFNGTSITSGSTFVFDGTNVGIGSSTPWGLLSVNGANQAANSPSFVVGSSTKTDLIVTQGGRVGVGTATPVAGFTATGGISSVTWSDGNARNTAAYFTNSFTETLPTSLSSIFGVDNTFTPAANSGLNINGTFFSLTLAGSSNFTGIHRGLVSQVLPTGSGTLSAQLVGLQGKLVTTSASTASLTAATNAAVEGQVQIAGTNNITAAAAFATAISFPNLTATASTVYGLRVLNPTKGASYTVTTLNGVQVDDLTVGGTNIAFNSQVSSGTNKWNVYAQGTASNYFAGMVGVGTTSPARALTVASSTAPQLMLSDGSLTSAAWNFRSAGGNLYLATSSPTTLATTSTSALTVLGVNGNVGIGVTGPQTTLDVRGTYQTFNSNISDAIFNIFSTNAMGADVGATMQFSGNSGLAASNITLPFAGLKGAKQTSSLSDPSGYLAFYTMRSGATMTEAMRINGSGNVGVGTTSPYARLSVAGAGTGTTKAFAVTDSSNVSRLFIQDNGEVNIGGNNSPGELLEVGGNIVSKGIAWTNAAGTAPAANTWNGVAYGNGRFVGVSSDGTNRVMTSPDGSGWAAATAAAAQSWSAVTYGGGLFVAVATDGTAGMMTSSDGVTWASSTSGAGAQTWNSIAYGDGVFAAVNSSAGAAGNTGRWSRDGISWTGFNGTGILGSSNLWRGIAYGNGYFVAVGTSAVMWSSDDAVNWTTGTAVSGTWNSVAYGNGIFVAVGASNAVMTATDPTGTWTSRTGATGTWKSVTYGNGLFVAVGSSGAVMTSPDGITWTARTAAGGNTNTWNSLAYGNGTFVAVASSGSPRAMYSGKSDYMPVQNNNILQGDVYMPGLVTGTNNRTLCINTTGMKLFAVNAACTTSSQRYKENIQALSYGLSEINQMNPVFFEYKDSYEKMDGTRTKRRVGFIAEEMETVIPEVVVRNSLGQIETIDYAYLTSVLTRGVQELSLRTANFSDTTTIRLDSLEMRLAALESASGTGSTSSIFSTSTLTAALGNLGIVVQQNIAQFNALIAQRFVATTAADGTSSAASVTIDAGSEGVVVTNVLVRPSTKIFITFTAPVVGTWWVSDKSEGGFTLMLAEPQAQETSFDYFLVQTESQLEAPVLDEGAPAYSVEQIGGTSAPAPSPAPAPAPTDGGTGDTGTTTDGGTTDTGSTGGDTGSTGGEVSPAPEPAPAPTDGGTGDTGTTTDGGTTDTGSMGGDTGSTGGDTSAPAGDTSGTPAQ